MTTPKKTVLYLRTDFVSPASVIGGAASHTLGVIRGLIAQGVRVLCAASTMEKQIKELKPARFKQLIERRTRYVPYRLQNVMCNFFFLFQILSFIKNEEIDYIYQRHGQLNSVGALLSWYKKIPLILEYNSSVVWEDLHWGGGKTWDKFLWLVELLEKMSLRRAQCIVVVSQVLKDSLIKMGVDSKKILVNPNGVNADEFDPTRLQNARQQIRGQHMFDDKFVFGFIGSFGPWHGINILKKIIPEIVKIEPRVHFLLIGDGSLKQDLELSLKKAGVLKKHVTFTGIIPQEKAKMYLAACDSFLSPTQENVDGTKFFGSPTKVFEYMSMAKPMIVSDVGQLSEIILPAIKYKGRLADVKNNQALGIIVQPDDVSGFVGACLSLVRCDNTFLKSLGDNARKRVERCYTWHLHVKKILEFGNRENKEIDHANNT